MQEAQEARSAYFALLRDRLGHCLHVVYEDEKPMEIRLYYGSREKLWIDGVRWKSTDRKPIKFPITEELCSEVANDFATWVRSLIIITYIARARLTVTVSNRSEHVAEEDCYGTLIPEHDTTFFSIVIAP
jgi:hypothetical protein